MILVIFLDNSIKLIFFSIISFEEMIGITKDFTMNGTAEPAWYCLQKDLDWKKDTGSFICLPRVHLTCKKGFHQKFVIFS